MSPRKDSQPTMGKSGAGFWMSRRQICARLRLDLNQSLYGRLPAHSATSAAEKRNFPVTRSSGGKERTMKIPHIFAATGLVVAAMTVSTSAEAQRWHGDRGHDRGWHNDRGWHDRGWHDRGWDRGRYWHGPRWRADYYGYGWRYPHCWTERRWHRWVRVCR